MKKLLIILLLVSVCAALEVPEDYQLAPNATRLSALIHMAVAVESVQACR